MIRLAVVGGGWAGLAAAVRATQAGHAVTLFETAGMPGGRARSDAAADDATDNGQHILLGGYARTLALMRDVGVDVERALLRVPLRVTYPDGAGFALSPSGSRLLAAGAALAGSRGFGLADKLSAVAMSLAWQLRGFRCPPSMTVDQLLRRVPTARVHRLLIEPLCVAALNTPSAEASAQVFLAVMHDSLFGARDASDLLLPQRPLAQLLPLPAVAWLRARGAQVHLRTRVTAIARDGTRWRVMSAGARDLAPQRLDLDPAPDRGLAPAGPDPFDTAEPDAFGAAFDQVILATPASEAARLTQAPAPGWSALAAALAHEPIVTISLTAPRRAWRAPMLALHNDDARSPAQFAFKLGAQPDDRDRVTLVVSAAGRWLDRGIDALTVAAVAQYRRDFDIPGAQAVDVASVRTDKRATFRCTAGVVRPAMQILPGLRAAGDYVAGPYPATLEAAVRAGESAAASTWESAR